MYNIRYKNGLKNERLIIMSYELQQALIIAAVIVGVLLVLYFGLGALFFFIALGNKKRPDPTVPCKDSLFERNADNENLIAGYKWYDTTYHQEVVIKNRKGENLHGVSKGGATTMMTTGEKLPENVVLAIEDCGFVGVKEIFTDRCKRKYHLPPKLVMPQASLINKLVNGFFFGQANCIKQLKKSKTPTLFIHGDKDDFVLLENLEPVYNACAAEKEKYIVKGAEHALSSHWFHEEYWQVVDNFLKKYFDVVER